MAIRDDKRVLFERLYQEFVTSYPLSAAGKTHVAGYERARADARKGYDEILAAEKRGDDITELVLKRLLPHNDSTFNRERQAWVTFAPAVTREIKSWFENAPHIKAAPKAWPTIAAALLRFVRRCVDHPEQLDAACAEFVALPQARGFQTGMLTPILNALSPTKFALVNNKSREVASFLLEQKLSGNIEDYASTNAAVHSITDEMRQVLTRDLEANLSEGDRFDMFCHWLVAVKKYPLRDSGYWKIAPGEAASRWSECRDGGFIAIGWPELGDLTGRDRASFDARRDECVKKLGWTKTGTTQAWRFFNQIKEGDRIVANKGWGEVVGIGTVVGPYYYEPGEVLPHRLPVEWDDTERRKISKPGWSMTLCRLDQADFEEVANAPVVEDAEPVVAKGRSIPPAAPLNPPYPVEMLAAESYRHALAEALRPLSFLPVHVDARLEILPPADVVQPAWGIMSPFSGRPELRADLVFRGPVLDASLVSRTVSRALIALGLTRRLEPDDLTTRWPSALVTWWRVSNPLEDLSDERSKPHLTTLVRLIAGIARLDRDEPGLGWKQLPCIPTDAGTFRAMSELRRYAGNPPTASDPGGPVILQHLARFCEDTVAA